MNTNPTTQQEHATIERYAFEYTKPKNRTLPPKNLYRYLEIDRIG